MASKIMVILSSSELALAYELKKSTIAYSHFSTS